MWIDISLYSFTVLQREIRKVLLLTLYTACMLGVHSVSGLESMAQGTVWDGFVIEKYFLYDKPTSEVCMLRASAIITKINLAK